MEKGYVLNPISGIDAEKHITTFARDGNVFSGGVMQFINLSNTFHKLFHFSKHSYTVYCSYFINNVDRKRKNNRSHSLQTLEGFRRFPFFH